MATGESTGWRSAMARPRGAFTLSNYLWMEVDDWPRCQTTLIEGPFIHHAAMAYGHYAEALVEACKYVPGLEPVVLGDCEPATRNGGR
jgi:hypothetical protein